MTLKEDGVVLWLGGAGKENAMSFEAPARLHFCFLGLIATDNRELVQTTGLTPDLQSLRAPNEMDSQARASALALFRFGFDSTNFNATGDAPPTA